MAFFGLHLVRMEVYFVFTCKFIIRKLENMTLRIGFILKIENVSVYNCISSLIDVLNLNFLIC